MIIPTFPNIGCIIDSLLATIPALHNLQDRFLYGIKNQRHFKIERWTDVKKNIKVALSILFGWDMGNSFFTAMV